MFLAVENVPFQCNMSSYFTQAVTEEDEVDVDEEEDEALEDGDDEDDEPVSLFNKEANHFHSLIYLWDCNCK